MCSWWKFYLIKELWKLFLTNFLLRKLLCQSFIVIMDIQKKFNCFGALEICSRDVCEQMSWSCHFIWWNVFVCSNKWFWELNDQGHGFAMKNVWTSFVSWILAENCERGIFVPLKLFLCPRNLTIWSAFSRRWIWRMARLDRIRIEWVMVILVWKLFCRRIVFKRVKHFENL